jgi:hypothetical protein
MRKFIALAIVAGLAPLAFADGNSASVPALATVQILAPVTVSTDGVTLNFGKVIVSTIPADVVMDQNGAVTAGGGADLFKGSGKTPTTVPHFSITKDPAATVAVVFTPIFPSGSFTIDPLVITNTNNFAGGNTAALTNQALYGRLDWTSGTTAVVHGYNNGTIGIAVNYN